MKLDVAVTELKGVRAALAFAPPAWVAPHAGAPNDIVSWIDVDRLPGVSWIGMGAASFTDGSPATPPGMRIRTGRFE